jgi:transcriptional regulator with XRE-family HTH domain
MRRMRRERGLSLEEVGGRTGFSIGFLSQIERGLSSPTLRVLAAVADALGVALAALFPGSVAEPDRGAVVVRSASRHEMQLWRSGIRKQLLTPLAEGARLNVTLVELEPGASTGDELYTHNGEEAGLILSGAMSLTVENETWTLREGDSFRFLSSRAHRFANVGEGVTRVIWVNSLT